MSIHIDKLIKNRYELEKCEFGEGVLIVFGSNTGEHNYPARYIANNEDENPVIVTKMPRGEIEIAEILEWEGPERMAYQDLILKKGDKAYEALNHFYENFGKNETRYLCVQNLIGATQ